MSGDVRNISVKNCQFLGTDVGLRFKSNRGRGGVVENIYISDIYMFNITTDSFLFDLYYGGKSASESLADGDTTPTDEQLHQVTEKTPLFRNIYVKNLVSRNARRAMFFNGLPEMNIANINLENAFITSRYGAELSESTDISFKNVTVLADEGPAFQFHNVKNFNSEGLGFNKGSSEKMIEIEGAKTAGMSFTALSEDLVEITPDVDMKQVIFNEDK